MSARTKRSLIRGSASQKQPAVKATGKGKHTHAVLKSAARKAKKAKGASEVCEQKALAKPPDLAPEGQMRTPLLAETDLVGKAYLHSKNSKQKVLVLTERLDKRTTLPGWHSAEAYEFDDREEDGPADGNIRIIVRSGPQYNVEIKKSATNVFNTVSVLIEHIRKDPNADHEYFNAIAQTFPPQSC